MRLKRLDIVGFKSFLEKTVVRFDEGITSIVGPNGCGKSNIVDAVRWVLGEQSSKHLRGGSMQDVIFSGSQTRPPVSMTEVTLTFVNNRPEELPSRYRAFAEIAVTRRLFRNGDSEYLINKTPCRLMDITEVFLGTGVGTKAYSIIEQGRIGLIVSAKADERRSLIEEAAGITRFKTKRRIAERKMEYTRSNLLRIGDLVSELGRRLDSLQRQAKKAERYKKLKSELQEVELHITAHRWLEIAATRSSLQRELSFLRNGASDLSAKVDKLEKDVRARRDRLAAEEARLADIQANAEKVEGRANVHAERVAGLGREREDLDSRTRLAQEEIAGLRSREARLVETIRRNRSDLVEIERSLSSSKTDLDARLLELTGALESVARLSRLAEAERLAESKAASKITQCESQISELTRRREELGVRREAGAAEIEQLRSRIEALEESRARQQEDLDVAREKLERMEADRSAAVEALAACNLSLEEQETEIHGLKDTRAEKRSRLLSLEEIQRNYEGYNQGVRSVMLEKSNISGLSGETVLGLVADLVRAEPPHEAAIEAVLGERLQHVLVTDQEAARHAVAWLADSESGRSAFIPRRDLRVAPENGAAARALTDSEGVVAVAMDVVRYKPSEADIVRHLLEDVIIARDLDVALKLWSSSSGVTFVTLAGDVIGPSGTISGGTRDSAGTGLLEARREIEELSNEVERLTKTLFGLESARGHLVKRKASLESDLEELSRNAHAEQITIVGKEKETSHSDEVLERLRERIAAVESEAAELSEALEDNAKDARAVKDALTAAFEEKSSHAARSSNLDEKLESEKRKSAELQEIVTELRVRVAGDNEKREALAKETERAENDVQEISNRLRSLSDNVEGSSTKYDDIDARIASDEAEARRLMEEARAMRASVSRGRESLSAASETVKSDEEHLDAMREALETRAAESKRIEIELREMEMGATHLAESVVERHATTISEAVHQWHLHPAPEEDDITRLEALRARVSRIGEVNLTAIREYDEIAERHAFLQAQQNDLEQSLSKLEKAITQVNKTSKARFIETFEQTNDLFRQLFPRLFKGGKAGLSLTDPSAPLESGVEIFAQPPGKKLQNVSLLSGGEKALTAVALIFAIFLVRPTPFCLLDEVDAPLDDTNVRRYNQLVREMSRHSQFILVTHNKSTMESADTLYGVTMEEAGISKLVSVRLSGEGPTAAAA